MIWGLQVPCFGLLNLTSGFLRFRVWGLGFEEADSEPSKPPTTRTPQPAGGKGESSPSLHMEIASNVWLRNQLHMKCSALFAKNPSHGNKRGYLLLRVFSKATQILPPPPTHPRCEEWYLAAVSHMLQDPKAPQGFRFLKPQTLNPKPKTLILSLNLLRSSGLGLGRLGLQGRSLGLVALSSRPQLSKPRLHDRSLKLASPHKAQPSLPSAPTTMGTTSSPGCGSAAARPAFFFEGSWLWGLGTLSKAPSWS